LGVRVIYKASFLKANRARGGTPRGPGLDQGLERLARVREAAGVPVLTDIHEPAQAALAAQVVDVIQIPAFLCRQTDLLEAAGRTGKPVNVKKGQWMAPEDMRGAVEKVTAVGSGAVAVTERGTFFGYGDLVVDMRAFARLRAATGAPVLFDATHAVQRPGLGPDGCSGGGRKHVPALLRAAAAAGGSGARPQRRRHHVAARRPRAPARVGPRRVAGGPGAPGPCLSPCRPNGCAWWGSTWTAS
jgi:2-dehydro-3-deoxyphosphooctonate aldolase (KDO 8-P synthase)